MHIKVILTNIVSFNSWMLTVQNKNKTNTFNNFKMRKVLSGLSFTKPWQLGWDCGMSFWIFFFFLLSFTSNFFYFLFFIIINFVFSSLIFHILSNIFHYNSFFFFLFEVGFSFILLEGVCSWVTRWHLLFEL